MVRGSLSLGSPSRGSRVSALAPQDLKQQEFFLGCSKVSGKVDWKMLDEAVFQVFQVKGVLVLGGWGGGALGAWLPPGDMPAPPSPPPVSP